MVEILKQGIYAPIAFEKQVAVIYAGNAGYLDGISLDQVASFEKELYIALDREKTILAVIRDTKDFSDETKSKLDDFLKDFTKTFAL